MAFSRLSSDLWLSRESRKLVNEPKEILLTGTKSRTVGGAAVAMKTIADSDGSMSHLVPFHDAVEWAKEAKQNGRFPHQTEHTIANLRAYTFQNPAYYSACNDCLYRSADMSLWEDFIDGLCVGIDSEVRVQAAPPELHRVAWVPSDVFSAHFAEGNEVLFKGFLSSSPVVQWQFLNVGSTGGKTPVVLTWGEAASRDAAHIQQYSVFPDEDEYVFRAFWRGIVRRRATQMSPGGMEVHHVFLDTFPQVPVLPKVLDSKETPTIAILAAALLICLHCGSGEAACTKVLHDALLKLEKGMSLAAVPVEAEEVQPILMNIWAAHWKMTFNMWADAKELFQKGEIRLAVVNSLGLLSSLPFLPVGLGGLLDRAAIMVIGSHYRYDSIDIPATEAERQRRQDSIVQSRSSATDAAKEFSRATMESAAKVLQSAPALPFHQVLQQIGLKFKKYVSTTKSLEELAIDDAQVEELEKERVAIWAHMTFELHMISALIDGGDDTMRRVYQSPFPLAEDPLNVAIRVGNAVFDDIPHSLPADEAAERSAALVAHMRRHLSRTRILVLVGEMDSGKTTLLNRLYKLSLPAGREASGRTKAISVRPHPRSDDVGFFPVLLADAPGVGDAVDARSDVIRMMMAIAALPGVEDVLRFVLVRQSGRPAEAPAIQDLIKHLGRQRILQLVTHVDSRYEEMLKSKYENLQKEKQKKRLWKETDLRKNLADEVIQDDIRNVGDEDFHYVCLGGLAATVFDGSDEENEDDSDEDDGFDLQSQFDFFKLDMKDFFGGRALSRSNLRKLLDKYLDLP